MNAFPIYYFAVRVTVWISMEEWTAQSRLPAN